MKRILIGAGILLGLAFSQQTVAQGKSGVRKSSSHSTSEMHRNNGSHDRDDDQGDNNEMDTRSEKHQAYKVHQSRQETRQQRVRHDNGLHRGWYKGKHKGWQKNGKTPRKY